jgi:hypothetical protein
VLTDPTDYVGVPGDYPRTGEVSSGWHGALTARVYERIPAYDAVVANDARDPSV